MTREEALALHRQALVIDSHNDSTVAHIRRGNLGLAGRAGAVAYLRQYLSPLGEGIQLDIPKMRQGGIDAGFFAVDTTRPWGNHLLYAMDALGYLIREVEEHPAELLIARRATDLMQAKREGKLAVLLAIENSNALEQSPHVLRLLYQLGVRTMTLTHSDRAWAGDGCEVENGGGLTGFGKRVVAQMNELGMLVDVSHLNERGFWDVLTCCQAPLIASHSCCRLLCDHARNLSDEQLRALAEKGGVVGLTFVPSFVDTRAPSLERFLDHLDHAVQVAGIDSVGLGSDFGGGDLLPDATAYPQITLGLAERGYTPEALRKILGENHLRLLRQVIG